MFGQTAIRSPTTRIAELIGNLRDLETRFRQLDPRDARRASADVAESVGSALEDIAGRFRNGAASAASEAARMGQRANLAGQESYAFLKSEAEAHPFAVLAVAAGIGIVIGASLYRRSRNSSPEPKRRRIRRTARK